ncbi:MAG: glycoside hydrolase family 3 C-terminal domain-containing protein [Candidatus Thorarchaeota archaeon]
MPDVEDRVSELLSKLTTREKFMLMTSHGRRRMYTTKPIKRVGIPSFKMTDGPLGAAYHSSGFKKNTRFPATISLAATWNRELAREIGVAMGREVRAVGRHMLLAPGMNIDRTPLNGRTFEYFSEDPFLTKELAIPFVDGVQSQRVGACVKHFAANNQETDRRSNSSEVDERTLHEIYLRAFRAVVREVQPWALMSCYNMVNGVYGSENKYLLREVLMDRWGFKGFVVSDWLATRNIKATEGCVNAGLSLEMPWPSKYKVKSLEKAHSEGRFTDETLDDLVRRYVRVMFLTGVLDEPRSLPKGERNTAKHQELARRAGEEGMVLLKNEEGLLPLDVESIERIALAGPNLKKKFGRIGYGGSSAVVPPYEVTPLDGFRERCGNKIDIVTDAAQADAAIVFAGLDHGRGKDSETRDRNSLALPEKQTDLINETADHNPNTIVVLIAGSPIAMDSWLENVPVVLMAWYPSMEGGRAIANVLFGDVNPSGKLPITFPKKLSDSPAHSTGTPRTFPGINKKVYYDEGIFMGYRWFDERGIEPLFPFGFGMSYTSFDYEDIRLDSASINEPESSVAVEVRVTNVGHRAGSDVVQVYSHDVESSVDRPPKELVGFQNVHLDPGEEKSVTVDIRAEDLAFYDVSTHDWVIEPGEFELLVGRSSQDIHARLQISYL